MSVHLRDLADSIVLIQSGLARSGRTLDYAQRAEAVDLAYQLLRDEAAGVDRARLQDCFVAIDGRIQALRPDLAGRDLSGLTEAFRERYCDVWAEWVAEAYAGTKAA